MPELPEVNIQLGELENSLSNLKSATDQIAEAKNAAQNVVDACQKTQLACARLTENTEEVFDKVTNTLSQIEVSNQSVSEQILQTLKMIQDIDFPAQFQKLDATISGINLGVQNLLNSYNNILVPKIDAIPTKVEAESQKIQQEIEQNQEQLENIVASKADAISNKVSTENDKIRQEMHLNQERLESTRKKWNIIQLCVTILSAIGIIVVLLIR
jgi:cysteinyl-tRNA synthetase